jgi:hypothetical protein
MNLYHKLNSIKLINKYDTDKQAEFRDGEQTVEMRSNFLLYSCPYIVIDDENNADLLNMNC